MVLFQDVGGKSFYLRADHEVERPRAFIVSQRGKAIEHFSYLPGMSLTRMIIMTEHLLLLASKDSFFGRVWAVRLRIRTGQLWVLKSLALTRTRVLLE